MSLITRCSACGTMFKVVSDQLKISEGWVRCGHCSEVFDASANLQTFVSDVPTGTPADAAAAVVATVVLAVNDGLSVPAADLWPKELEDRNGQEIGSKNNSENSSKNSLDKAATPHSGTLLDAFVPEVQVSLPADLAADVFFASVNPEPADYSAVSPALPEERVTALPASVQLNDAKTTAENQADQVSFVRDARRDAFWRRPLMRLTLVSVALVLLTVLLLQIVVFQRNTLALLQPWLNPGLQTLCQVLRCEISPPRQIESIVIDGSSFNKLANDAYRLKVVIRNTGTIALAMPALELTLTDSQDQALVRRVLTPSELGAGESTLSAGAEFSGTLAFTVQSPGAAVNAAAGSADPAPSPQTDRPLRIAGYRVLAFYP